MQERSCALVVIGNEILSGKVQDSNSYFTAHELRSLGVALRRIAVVPDELDDIAREVRSCSQLFDFVLTSGGVGPTHDDVTMAAIALAFDRKLIRHPELEEIISRRAEGKPNPASLKMADIPEGASLNYGGEIAFPTVQVQNVFILPGIPQLFEAKLRALRERFTSDPYFMHAIYLNSGESAIAAHLDACLKRFPALMLGSYPRIGDNEYRVKLTLESKDRSLLEQAYAYLLEVLPGDAVVKLE
jgi:molybdenum cofactor synthesis domain-containing protein